MIDHDHWLHVLTSCVMHCMYLLSKEISAYVLLLYTNNVGGNRRGPQVRGKECCRPPAPVPFARKSSLTLETKPRPCFECPEPD